MCHIRLENVSKIYPSGGEEVAAVSNLSMEVECGEFVVVTGPSGCGKSTLLHMIGGLSEPSAGSIFIMGKSLYGRTRSGLALYRRREVGIVYQFYNLVPELTARENLILPALMDRRRIDGQWVDEIFEILGMQDKQNVYPSRLSGGQQQKIAVGRALVNHPSLLLADEPTGNLDSSKRDELLGLFYDLNEQEGMTVILVTHDDYIASAAKRNIIMADGEIVEDEVRAW